MKAPTAERVDLPVSGMTCAACARAIELALAGTPGVERASVNLATNTATVEFDPGRTGMRDFIGAIEELGYGVPETEPAKIRALWPAFPIARPTPKVTPEATAVMTSCRRADRT